MLQIPAFLSRQTDLIAAAAATGRVVNIKKGQFLAPDDIRHAVAKAVAAGNTRVIVTERGTSFGYHNLVVDMRAFPMMRAQGVPVVFDVTHSLQLPGGGDGVTAGLGEYIEPLARPVWPQGLTASFSKCTTTRRGPEAMPRTRCRLDRLEPLLRRLMAIDAIVKAGTVVQDGDRHETRPHGTPQWVISRSPGRFSRPKPRRSWRWSIGSTSDSSARSSCCGTAAGRVILTGMGKSGIICRKIAATLTSTGTPALLSPSRGGDSRRSRRHPERRRRRGAVVQRRDRRNPAAARDHSPARREAVAITGTPASTLAQAADVALDCSVAEEACPLNLVPTASTTAALAIGDALAMTLLVEKGFVRRTSPTCIRADKLGKRLMRVEALMHAGRQCPIVKADTPMRDVIYEMSSKQLGMTCVVDGGDALLGIITDGDLRRQMERDRRRPDAGGRRRHDAGAVSRCRARRSRSKR